MIVIVFLFALVLPSSALAVTAIQFITPTNISGTYDSTRRNYDTTAIKPSGMSACGVLVRYRFVTNSSSNSVGFYHGDSTDTYTWKAYNLAGTNTWEYGVAGLNAAEEFKYYGESVNLRIEVMGFFDCAHITFRTDSVAFTPGSSAFADVDISPYTGADPAIGAFFHIDSNFGSGSNFIGWRAKGSSDGIVGRCGKTGALNGCGLAMTKLDASKICQFRQDSLGGASARFVGYVKSGVTFYDPMLNKSTATTGAWEAVTGLAGVAAYVEMSVVGSAVDGDQGVARNSAVNDTYGSGTSYHLSIIETTGGQIEQKIENTNMDLYLRATFDADASGTPMRRRGVAY